MLWTKKTLFYNIFFQNHQNFDKTEFILYHESTFGTFPLLVCIEVEFNIIQRAEGQFWEVKGIELCLHKHIKTELHVQS